MAGIRCEISFAEYDPVGFVGVLTDGEIVEAFLIELGVGGEGGEEGFEVIVVGAVDCVVAFL